MLDILLKRLNEAKRRSGLTWAEIAQQTGVSHSTINQLVNGYKKNPTIEVYGKLIEFAEKQSA